MRQTVESSTPPLIAPGYELMDDGVSAADWARLLNAGGQLGPWNEERVALETALLVAGTQVFLSFDSLLVAGAGIYDRDPGSWEIGWICVHPDHRRKGLGESVIRLALQRAYALTRRPVLLYTEDHRLDAIRLYVRLGFRPVSRHASHRRRWRRVSEGLPTEAAHKVVSLLQDPDDSHSL
jgi:mycothiol synthase